MWPKILSRPILRRSIFIATGWPARWDGCPSRCSAWTRGRAFELAHHLGRALQLTNILRDIDEDAAIGRLYLPREYLEEINCCRSLDPLAIVRGRKSTRSAARWPPSPTITMTRPSRILAARPKGRHQDAAPDGRGLFRDLARQRGAGLCPAAPPRFAAQEQAAVAGAAPRAFRMSRRVQSLMSSVAALAGLSAATILASRGAAVTLLEAARPGGRALPFLFRCRDRRGDRQWQSSGVVGQPRGA